MYIMDFDFVCFLSCLTTKHQLGEEGLQTNFKPEPELSSHRASSHPPPGHSLILILKIGLKN